MSLTSVIWVVLVHYPWFSTSCWWGYPYGAGGDDPNADLTTTTEEPDAKDLFDLNSRGAYGGFRIPDSVKKEWRDWAKMYKNLYPKHLSAEEIARLERERGILNGWPASWYGLGAGNPGYPIPPWGYRPQMSGAPLYCYLGPESEVCAKPTKASHRWGFNAFEGRCVRFMYSGCGGNENNFIKELDCINICMRKPPSGCDLETDIIIEDDLRRMISRKCGDRK